MRIIVTRRANGDLLREFRHVAKHNPAAAERMTRRIDAVFRQISEFPDSGRPRDELEPGLRSRIADYCLIFYRVEPDRVIILRVIDGRMDIEAEFRT